MLITFKGEGCSECPFYHYYFDRGDEGNECIIHKYVEGMTKLFVIGRYKPDGCPFKGFPGNLEIQADE